MTAAAFISIASVAKHYAAHRALDDVSLQIQRGEFVALVGQSGSGKTTLLKSINGLVEIDAGCIAVDGADIASLAKPSLRRRIGYVFQQIGLFPHMTVGENIAIVLRLDRADETEKRARVEELLDLVSLPRAFASRTPAELSGGQAQRVGVARALAARPSAMLMDEPFGALDPLTRDTLGQSYRQLHGQLGLTTLMVTHDMGEALLMADRVIVMSAGRIIADSTPRALINGQRNEEVEAMLAVPRRQADRLLALRDRR